MSAQSHLIRSGALWVTVFGVGLMGCQTLPTQEPRVNPAAPASAPPPEVPPEDDRAVRSTILQGERTAPLTPQSRPVPRSGGGSVLLSYQGVEVPAVAKSVLGDVLGLPYSVDAAVDARMTLQAAGPVARADILPLFEESLRAAGYVMVPRSGVYVIQPLLGRTSAPVSPTTSGYGDETLSLTYASAVEIKRLLDPVLPNTITLADPARNVVILSGTSAQRRAARDMIRQFDVDWMKGMSFALIIPERTDSRLIAPELDKLLNSPGAPTAGLVRLLPMERLNGIIAITSQAAYLDDVRRWVEVLDREGESASPRLFVYRVQNGRSSDLSKVLASALGGSVSGLPGATSPETPSGSNPPDTGGNVFAQQSQGGVPSAPAAPAGGLTNAGASAAAGRLGGSGGLTIGSDEANNAVVVFCTPRDYAVIEDALRKLDIPPLQVMIDAAITEVTLNDNLRYGVQWFLRDGERQVSFTQGPTSTPTRVFPGLSFLYNNGADITATLNALRDATDIDVLSAPKLMVLNNHTASLQIGDQVPVTTSSAISTSNSDAPLVSTVEYRDTGVILKVTPRVNDGGLVLLDIAQEVSDVAETSTSGIDSPTIQQRRIATSVAVRDGQTIALGGLIRHRRSVGRTRVPLLGDIPVVGQLFGDTERDGKRTELLVLLTPRVVRTAVDADAVTEELKSRIRAIQPLGVTVRP